MFQLIHELMMHGKKSLLSFLFALVLFFSATAQDAVYQFNEVVNHTRSEVKDQCRTGTCWSYSTVSFIESEIYRQTGKMIDLSEMFNVRVTYPKKAEMYVRYHGKYQFGPGSLCHDVINVVASAGMVPESAYPGLPSEDLRHDHGQLDAVLEAVVKAVVDKPDATYGDAWKASVQSVLDAYLGDYPQSFTYEGERYSPASFRDMLGFKPDAYVSLTSFSHHPFYTDFVLEVPDNFSMGRFYNLPLDHLEQLVVKALENGYTVAWDADVSERGFRFKDGIAVLPADQDALKKGLTERVEEANVNQDSRQQGFDNFSTTDDHLMHITGLATDQYGTRYFIVKNSWGSDNPYGGYQYVSTAYFRSKTVSVLLHRDALGKDLQKQLGL